MLATTLRFWWRFGHFYHQHHLSFNIGVRRQQPKDVTNIEILSLTSKNCHQDKVTNIYVAPIFHQITPKRTISVLHNHYKIFENGWSPPHLTGTSVDNAALVRELKGSLRSPPFIWVSWNESKCFPTPFYGMNSFG